MLDAALQRGAAGAASVRKAATPFVTPLASPASFGAEATPSASSRFEFMLPGVALPSAWNALPTGSLADRLLSET